MAVVPKAKNGVKAGASAKARADKAESTEKAAREKRVTIVSVVKALLEKDASMGTKVMIEAVKAKFPDSKFDETHVAYYRNKFRKEGMNIPMIKDTTPGAKTAKPKEKVAKNAAPAPKAKAKPVAKRKVG